LSVPAVVPLVMSTVFDPIGVSPKRTVTVHTPETRSGSLLDR
jgi:hypothetical protein